MTLWQSTIDYAASLSASDYAALASALIALIALFRPEIMAAIQRKKAFVDFHPRPSKKVIIGFRGCPRCWLDGTLDSVNSDALISDAALKIIRQRDTNLELV